MNRLITHTLSTVSLFLLFTSVHGQVIDESIARKLGLIKSGTSASARNIAGSNTRLVELNTGQMREIVFPEQGELKIKTKDRANFEILNVNNSLYVSPKNDLTEPVVGIFVLKESKRSYVLNFKTVSATLNNQSMVIGTPITTAIIDQSTPTIKRLPVPGHGPRQKRTEYDIYVDLASFASRSAYSPERVIVPPKGIKQDTLPRRIKGLESLTRDKRIKVKPLSAWVKKNVYLTIVELENTSNEIIALRPELIRGAFVAKAFEHNQLGTSESNRYSAVYLISQAPLKQTLWR